MQSGRTYSTSSTIYSKRAAFRSCGPIKPADTAPDFQVQSRTPTHIHNTYFFVLAENSRVGMSTYSSSLASGMCLCFCEACAFLFLLFACTAT